MSHYDPDRHHRRSIRLKGYDYSQPGAYFFTISAQGRRELFGSVADDEMHLNAAGEMVHRRWQELGRRFAKVALDAFVVMPNHAHGIVFLENPSPKEGLVVAGSRKQEERRGTTERVPLSKVVQWLKTVTTNEYIRGVENLGWPPFDGKLWQRNYWERVIRDERELARFRRYIVDNPLQWDLDRENPDQKERQPAA